MSDATLQLAYGALNPDRMMALRSQFPGDRVLLMGIVRQNTAVKLESLVRAVQLGRQHVGESQLGGAWA